MNKNNVFAVTFGISILTVVLTLIVLFFASPAEAGGRQWFFNLIFQNEAAIDENSARIDELEQCDGSQSEEPAPKKLYANGKSVGIIVDDNINLTLEFNSSFEPVEVGSNGVIEPDKDNFMVHFSEPDCRGEAYVPNANHSEYHGYAGFRLKPNKGKIYACRAPECASSLYYRSRDEANYYFVNTKSKINSAGNCLKYDSGVRWYYYKVLPNDPAVTGIDEYPFPLPLTFDGMEKLQMKLVTR